jgi:hypothetical protein
MRWLAMPILVGLMAGCQDPAPAALPDEYTSNPVVESCAAHVQPAEAVRGELLYDGTRLERVPTVGAGTLARAARMEIGRGEPLQALAERLRRADHLSIEADVTFDGWVLRKSACPSLDGDTYFVARFTNIVQQETGIK